MAASGTGFLATERGLRQVAQQLETVALRKPLERSPRVLLFGGANRIFVDAPENDFFEERGILIKTTEMSEFMCFCSGRRHRAARLFPWPHCPADQCSLPVLLSERFPPTTGRAPCGRPPPAAVLDPSKCSTGDGGGSRPNPDCCSAQTFPFREVARKDHQCISLNGYTEAPITVGRYAALLTTRAFDGVRQHRRVQLRSRQHGVCRRSRALPSRASSVHRDRIRWRLHHHRSITRAQNGCGPVPPPTRGFE